MIVNTVPYTYLYAKTISGKIIKVSVTTGNICSFEGDLWGLVLFHFMFKAWTFCGCFENERIYA